MKKSLLLSATLCFFLSPLLLATGALAAEPSQALEGRLSIIWGDSQPGEEHETHRRLTLTNDAGVVTPLSMSDELLQGGVFRWNGSLVKVFPATEGETAKGELRVAAIQLLEETLLGGGVTGSQPWVSILCKYSDIAAEPRNLAYFQGMYDNAPGRLDHYWREVSYDQIDIVGSTAVDWVNLPNPQSSYVSDPGSGTDADLNSIFNHCTAAVDHLVDFSLYVGINIMINDLLDCCAWGGSRFTTLDGVTRSWRTTWNPPWGFENETVIAHEMGHGFGLPHANNFDADDNPYDSPWDVMSSAWGNATNDPTYGTLGKHINAYHKDQLGWFAPARRFVTPDDSRTTITLDHTGISDSSNYLIATIPIAGNHWYTVEARQRFGDYELALAGDAVIIHEVRTNRGEPSWAVDADQPPADFGSNPGTMWTVGETFTDAENQISVTVESATADGFIVTIEFGDSVTIFEDGFESGDTTIWSSQLP